MAYKMGNKAIIVTVAAVGVVLLGLGIAFLSGAFGGKETDPYRQNSSQQTTDESDSSNDTTNTDNTSDETPADTTNPDTPTSNLDPATVSMLPIEDLGISVAYVKGIGGFEYQILRTQAGTSYVEFRNPDFVGTKCTDDEGAFASIIINPTATEDTSTITQKVTLDGKVYGLSLLGNNCTSNVTLFNQYQDSFKRAFSLLKKIDSN